jgi:hypothetical protein
MERVVGIPRRQRGIDAAVQLARVAAMEVEQVRPLQRERVARVVAQDLAPGVAGAGPVAGGEAQASPAPAQSPAARRCSAAR